jgi:exonuclease SbcC
MRPLRVRIKGLRSFRTEREIDFSDLGLVAIVGDTGAGKSSILEAITYALYNATTWDQRGVKQLISDGANTMSVQLDFSADGQVYRLTRSTSRGAYPPPGHSLVCLSDPSLPRLDSEAAIKAEVELLIGLDWDGFTSAVILPQGRFQTLLQATPTDRTEILKGIFRLGELAEAREHAQALAIEYRGKLDELQLARGQLLPDPTAAAKEAGRQKREAAKEDKRLRALKTEVATQEKVAKSEDDAAEKLDSAAERVTKANVHPSRDLCALLPILEELDAKRGELEQAEKDAESDESRLKSALDRAEEAGEGEGELARAKAILERLIDDLPKLSQEQRELAEASRELTRDEAELAKDERSLKKLQTEADRKARLVTEAEGAEKKARAELQNAKDLLAEFRTRAKDEQGAQNAVARTEGNMKEARDEADKAQKAGASANERLAVAAAALDELQKQHAAAHAAQGLNVGDPCPICRQTIPADFKAPRIPTEHATRKAYDQAKTAAETAHEGRITTAATCRHLEKTLAEARETAKEARRTARSALRRLNAVLGEIDLAAGDPELLRPLREGVEEREATVKDLRQHATEARSAAERAEAGVRPRRKALGDRKKGLRATAKRLDGEAATLERDRGTLPTRFQPAQGASEARLRTLLTRLDTRLGELERLRRERATLQQRQAEIRRDQKELAQRRKGEFDDPRRRAEKAVLLLHQRADEAAPIAVLDVPAPPEEEITFAGQVDWVEALEKRADEIVSALLTRAQDAEARATTAREAVADALGRVGARDVDALDELLIAASADHKGARDQEDKARGQIPIAKDLDRRIVPLRDAIVVLDALAALLTDGRFIGYVVSRRQRALLGLASEVLGAMTGARYGFAEDFRIIDRISGQPRNAKTLSGGETFLASLALALGLVELAARGGGRLEALFLDEGFGSLDADALDEALGELERRAQAGRLVAVISHVRAVAERIEHVLRVTRRPEGSEVAPIVGTEREEFIAEEVEEGLLA